MKKNYGLNQDRIAEMLGVSQAEISKYLSGISPKRKLEIDENQVRKFVESRMVGDELESQRKLCAACPKGAETSCLIMGR